MLRKIKSFIATERRRWVINSLRYAAQEGDLKEVKKCIEQLRKWKILFPVLNAEFLSGTILRISFRHITIFGPPHYEIETILLEAGARPEARERPEAMTAYHMAVLEKNLSTLRLLLWFESDHPDYQFEAYEIRNPRAYHFIEVWQSYEPNILTHINETTRDFREARRLLQSAEEAFSVNPEILTDIDIVDAAFNFSKVANTCIKYSDIEASIDQVGADVLTRFYAGKALGFQAKAYDLLQSVDNRKPIEENTSFSFARSNEILKELSKLARILGKHREADAYQRRISVDELQHAATADDPRNDPDLYQTAQLPIAQPTNTAISFSATI